MKTLVCVRGLPGSGKTTFAEEVLRPDSDPVSADQWFEKETQYGRRYEFNPDELDHAHNYSQSCVEDLMHQSDALIVVANTFSRHKELEPYRLLAERYGYQFVAVDLYDGGLSDVQLTQRNVHGVPRQTINRMRSRWEK